MQWKTDVLCVGAHPDDVEGGMGGTIIKLVQKKYEVGILDLTRGEKGTRGNREIRDREAKKAQEILGVAFRENADLPDAALQDDIPSRIVVVEKIRRYRPRFVFTFWHRTRHPDHRAAHYLVTSACFFAGVGKFPAEGEPFRPQKIIYFREWYDFRPTFIVDISDVMEKKLEALAAYSSQFDPLWPAPQTVLSDEKIKMMFLHRTRFWGSLIGVEFGEPFKIYSPVGTDDPIPLLVRSIW
ncbi:MAG: bacillithiol biosynthesis deacetylase BshB1 [bacterium JZ-2024 1]